MTILQRYLHRVHRINMPVCPFPCCVFETTVPFISHLLLEIDATFHFRLTLFYKTSASKWAQIETYRCLNRFVCTT